jgi:hypothetical protein
LAGHPLHVKPNVHVEKTNQTTLMATKFHDVMDRVFDHAAEATGYEMKNWLQLSLRPLL